MHAPNFRTLDLNLLRVFDEVMSERNLTRAANNLALTQPAVSNALKRLRDALGDDLLQRQGYGVEPTPAALTIWPAVREALAHLQVALGSVPFDAAHTAASFVLTMADATAAMLMPPLVEIIAKEAPQVQLRVVPLTTRDPRKLLDAGDADVAVGHFPRVLADITAHGTQGASVASGQAPARFEHLRLYDGQYQVVMRAEHPLARKKLTLEAFCKAHHLLVSFSGRPFGIIDEALAALGKQRKIVLTVNQFFTAGRVVVNSDLLTVIPQHFVPATGMADQLHTCPLPMPVPPVHVDAVWQRRHTQRAAHQWLRAALARAAQATFMTSNALAR
jgi:DNA-binding transcriptional LysR family regulator